MNKIKRIFFALIIIMFLFGCSQAANNNDESEKLEEDAESLEVTILLPAKYFEGASEDDVIAALNEHGMEDITISDNGTFVVTMSLEEHQSMLQELKADIDDEIESIIENMDVAAIKDVSLNDSTTELTVWIDQDVYDGNLGEIVLMDFSLHAMFYQALNGVSEHQFEFDVVYVDSETGDEFDRDSFNDE